MEEIVAEKWVQWASASPDIASRITVIYRVLRIASEPQEGRMCTFVSPNGERFESKVQRVRTMPSGRRLVALKSELCDDLRHYGGILRHLRAAGWPKGSEPIRASDSTTSTAQRGSRPLWRVESGGAWAGPADWSLDGRIDSADLFAFLTAFFQGGADHNMDGLTNSSDFFLFIADFFG